MIETNASLNLSPARQKCIRLGLHRPPQLSCPFCAAIENSSGYDSRTAARDTWTLIYDTLQRSAPSDPACLRSDQAVNLIEELRDALRRLAEVEAHIRLAEHKIDQALQGEAPQTIRMGIALKSLRDALLLLTPAVAKGGEDAGHVL